MTKKIALISSLALMLASCGSTGEQDPKISTNKETTTTASETVSISESVLEEEITLRDVQNWATSDIWNKGFCDIGYYVKTGKDSTGRDIDIEFSINNLKIAMGKKDIYNEFLHNNYADYEQLLLSWDKMIEQTDILFEKVTTETPRPNDESYEFNNDLFHQYYMSFYSECNSPTKGAAVTTAEKTETEKPEESVPETTTTAEPEEVKTEKLLAAKEIVGDDPQAFINAILAEDDVLSADQNDDGSVTIVCTEEKYIEYCDSYRQSSRNTISGKVQEGKYPTVTAVSYDDDLYEFYITVTDYDAFINGPDVSFKWQIAFSAGFYHAALYKDNTLTLHYLDQNGNEITSEVLN
ncbi:hypothetical protein [Ruminococcus sp.]|uniref:hypothetical protein n=1 Tax=Ruminococcus sp. TaxID=41978 RepID=UPI00258B8AA0|nr:hypothetical protein [Ruminococcus sp.]MCR5020295.1 hypothetical protein [Ruminococcus sp.]